MIYDQDAVINATIEPTAGNPAGTYQANVYTPSRDTEFSIRTAHKFSESTRLRSIQLPGLNAQNQGVGGQTLAAAGYTNQYREDDFVAHLDQALKHSC